MSPADLDLLDGYNCTEMWLRRRADKRWSTFDDLKCQSDAFLGKRHGSIIEFACETVAKCSQPPKNQQPDFVAHPALNVHGALLLEKFRLKLLHNF